MAYDDDPSEFSHGRGLAGNLGRGYVLSPYEKLKATRMTDPGNPEASEEDVYTESATHSSVDADGVYVAGTLRSGVTKPVTQSGEIPSSGQHKRLDPSRYTPGHDPEGDQSGEAARWRNSVPPNPVGYEDSI